MKSSLPPYWEHFNFDHDLVESGVSSQKDSYQGLSQEALYTRDEDLVTIFSYPAIEGSFCDLGCGTGRTALLYGALFRDRVSIGIEFEKKRLEIGEEFRNRFDISNVSLVCGDLLTSTIPIADNYFLYFPTGPVLDRILSVLSESKHSFKLIAIESHGDLLPRIDLENWLKFKAEIPLRSRRHHGFARIYERNSDSRDGALFPFTLTYQKKVLVVSQEGWLGDTYGMEWVGDQKFDLLTPPRTISWKDVVEVKNENDFEEKVQVALRLRRKGPLTVHTKTFSEEGFIRKIFLKPTFQLELSSGKKVEWSDVIHISEGNEICYDSSQGSSS